MLPQARLQDEGRDYFDNSFRVASWQLFCTCSQGNSPGSNFASIFFKLAGKGESSFPLFAIKNQPDQM